MTHASAFVYGADGLPYIKKSPSALLDYSFNWSDWLSTDETIADSTWVVEDIDGQPTIEDDGLDADAVIATVWLSGGTDGASYRVTNSITTDRGRGDSRTIKINCKDR